MAKLYKSPSEACSCHACSGSQCLTQPTDMRRPDGTSSTSQAEAGRNNTFQPRGQLLARRGARVVLRMPWEGIMATHRFFILAFAALPLLATGAFAQDAWRYRNWDRNGDGIITRAEWR